MQSMGRYRRRIRKCKVTGEAAPVMAGRKRKASCGEEFVRRRNFVDSTAEKADSANSDEQNASCFSSNNGSVEVDNDTSKFVDLEEEEETDELESSTYKLEACRKRKETTPLPNEDVRVEQADTPEMKSTPSPKATPPPSRENSHRQLTADDDADKPPTEAELDDFFAEANAQIQQKFAKKYNFDISTEKPLEGRFEWVRVEP